MKSAERRMQIGTGYDRQDTMIGQGRDEKCSEYARRSSVVWVMNGMGKAGSLKELRTSEQRRFNCHGAGETQRNRQTRNGSIRLVGPEITEVKRQEAWPRKRARRFKSREDGAWRGQVTDSQKC